MELEFPDVLEDELVAVEVSELDELPPEEVPVEVGACTDGASCVATVVDAPGSTGLAQTPPEAVDTPFAWTIGPH